VGRLDGGAWAPRRTGAAVPAARVGGSGRGGGRGRLSRPPHSGGAQAARVFGWEFRQAEGFDNYLLYTAGPGELGGGIGLRGSTAPDAVRNYIDVDSVDASVDLVTANGGTVVTPKTDIGFGWYAAVTDTEGNEIGLYQSKPRG
jgi:hypothetical protein